MSGAAGPLLEGASAVVAAIALAARPILAVPDDVLAAAVAAVKHLDDHAQSLPKRRNNNTREPTTILGNKRVEKRKRLV